MPLLAEWSSPIPAPTVVEPPRVVAKLLPLHLRVGVNLKAPGFYGADLVAFFFQRVDHGILELTLSNLVRSQRATNQPPAEAPEEAEAGSSWTTSLPPFVKPLSRSFSLPRAVPFTDAASVGSGARADGGRLAPPA